jgi:hypothetical protein
MQYVFSSPSGVVCLYSCAEFRPRPAPSEAMLNHGVPVCPACEKFPRHTGSEYCGSGCERWAAEKRERAQRRQWQQQRPLRQGQQQQNQKRWGQDQDQDTSGDLNVDAETGSEW